MTKPLGFEVSSAGKKATNASAKSEAWARFDAEIQKGVNAAERGELFDAKEVFSEAKARLRAAIAKKRG